MRTSARASVFLLSILVGCAGCETVSWRTYQMDENSWAYPTWNQSFVPVFGVGVGTFWEP